MITSYTKDLLTSYITDLNTSFTKDLVTSYTEDLITPYTKDLITSYTKLMDTSYTEISLGLHKRFDYVLYKKFHYVLVLSAGRNIFEFSSAVNFLKMELTSQIEASLNWVPGNALGSKENWSFIDHMNNWVPSGSHKYDASTTCPICFKAYNRVFN